MLQSRKTNCYASPKLLQFLDVCLNGCLVFLLLTEGSEKGLLDDSVWILEWCACHLDCAELWKLHLCKWALVGLTSVQRPWFGSIVAAALTSKENVLGVRSQIKGRVCVVVMEFSHWYYPLKAKLILLHQWMLSPLTQRTQPSSP